MANLNLSEFTEKLFVADADHTFIWDTAASISKRVSRNSWLNSGTLISNAPVTISQTWNNAEVAFTGFKVNATSTASANGSLFLDLQLGGVSQFKIDRNSHIFVSNANSRLDININNVPVAAFFAGGLMRTYGSLGFSDTTTFPNDLILTRDGAGQLALRNGALAQTFNVYGTYTSGTSYERLSLSAPTAANAIIGTNKGSGGGTARGLDLHTDGAARMTITTAGNVGIGTTAPGAKLEVVGNILVNGATQIIDDGNILSVKGSTTNIYKAGYVVVTSGDNLVTTYQGSVTSGGFFGTFTNHKCFIRTSNAERVTIDTVGNVGIGTTSPTSKLQVSAGDVEVDTIAKGVILKSPDGTRYRVTVANGGTLSVAAV